MSSSTLSTVPQGYREVGEGRFRENVGAASPTSSSAASSSTGPDGRSPRPTMSSTSP